LKHFFITLLMRPGFYRRIRLFCELHIGDVASATGISPTRLAAIETGRRKPNDVERRLLESFLRARLKIVLDMDGPMPEWVSTKTSGRLTAGEGAD
jgi:transcriptional regulator with XRE-family HTH domain